MSEPDGFSLVKINDNGSQGAAERITYFPTAVKPPSSLSLFFPVLLRTHSCKSAENLGEIGLGRKARGYGDLGNGLVCLRQKIPGHLKPPVNQVLNGGHPKAPGKCMGQMELVHMSGLRQRIQGNTLVIIGI